MFTKIKKNINRILSMVLGGLVMLSAYTNCSSSPQVTDSDDEKIIMVATQ